MSKRLMIIVLVLAFAASVAAQQNAISDEAAIRQTIEHYLDGWKYNNVEEMKKALHPKAVMFFHLKKDNQDLAETTGERFLAAVERNGVRKDPKSFSPRIVSIDITTDVSSVKLELSYSDSWLYGGKVSPLEPSPGVIETRYLSLIKFNDGWKIISDTFNVREGK